MKLVIFGLTVSSSWGNGHATLWRGLWRALARRGHEVVFFERDVPYYARHRDVTAMPGGELVLYGEWEGIAGEARRQVEEADVAMVTSYCPDGVAAGELVLSSGAGRKVFYDLDTPVTLARLEAGEAIGYIGPEGLRGYDLVLSYTGGAALGALREKLGAGAVAPLYGSVDAAVHRRVEAVPWFRADLSYLGTYAADRQARLEQLLIEPARRLPERFFMIGGAMYPGDFPWRANIGFINHVPPGEHAAFYSSCRVQLSVTREAMARMGYCPSGRLFEAAACGVPVLTDEWEGIGAFFEVGKEILVGRSTEDAVGAVLRSDAELGRVGEAARERVMACHTADCRAVELERLLETGAGVDVAAGAAGGR